jgi:hypothetical protein
MLFLFRWMFLFLEPGCAPGGAAINAGIAPHPSRSLQSISMAASIVTVLQNLFSIARLISLAAVSSWKPRSSRSMTR